MTASWVVNEVVTDCKNVVTQKPKPDTTTTTTITVELPTETAALVNKFVAINQ